MTWPRFCQRYRETAAVVVMTTDCLSDCWLQILFTTDTALGCKNADVRAEAVHVVGELISLLPEDVLKSNIAVLLIGLYPIIENCGSIARQHSPWGGGVTEKIRSTALTQMQSSYLDSASAGSESDMLEIVEPSTQETSKASEHLL